MINGDNKNIKMNSNAGGNGTSGSSSSGGGLLNGSTGNMSPFIGGLTNTPPLDSQKFRNINSPSAALLYNPLMFA